MRNESGVQCILVYIRGHTLKSINEVILPLNHKNTPKLFQLLLELKTSM